MCHNISLWKGTTILGRTCCGHLQGATNFCSEAGGSRVLQDTGTLLVCYIVALHKSVVIETSSNKLLRLIDWFIHSLTDFIIFHWIQYRFNNQGYRIRHASTNVYHHHPSYIFYLLYRILNHSNYIKTFLIGNIIVKIQLSSFESILF
jgi:hypothetical protein